MENSEADPTEKENYSQNELSNIEEIEQYENSTNNDNSHKENNKENHEFVNYITPKQRKQVKRSSGVSGNQDLIQVKKKYYDAKISLIETETLLCKKKIQLIELEIKEKQLTLI